MDGTFAFKELDRSGEKNISQSEWWSASALMEKYVRDFHGVDFGDMYKAHHEIVRALTTTIGWSRAVIYDICSREMAAAEPLTDLACKDNNIVNDIMSEQMAAAAEKVASTSNNFATPNRGIRQSGTNQNRFEPYKGRKDTVARLSGSSGCYRCGSSGHLVRDCTARVTVAGKQCAQRSTSVDGTDSALVAPEGGEYCFQFTRSNGCKFMHNCRHYHGCPICGSTKHGATGCTSFGK